jgi:hypothetical protein
MDRVYYAARNNGALELKSSLMECQNSFKNLISMYSSVIMTSATLATGGDFVFLKNRLGIENFKERIIGSPFDYRTQAFLYVDNGLPLPDKGDNELFQQESLKVIERLIDASRGRAGLSMHPVAGHWCCLPLTNISGLCQKISRYATLSNPRATCLLQDSFSGLKILLYPCFWQLLPSGREST